MKGAGWDLAGCGRPLGFILSVLEPPEDFEGILRRGGNLMLEAVV